MKKIFVIGLAAVMLLSSGCSESKVQTEASTVEAVQKEQTIDAFGTVKTNDVKDIYLDFPALIEKVSVKEGDKVKNGDVLLTINYEEYKSEIRSKEIELSSVELGVQKSKLELEKLKKDLQELKDYLKTDSHPDLKKLLSDLDNGKSTYEDSLQDLQNKQELYKINAISQDELRGYQRKVQENEKALAGIEASIEKTKYSLKKEMENLELSVKQKTLDMGSSEDKKKELENSIKLMKDKISKSCIKGNDIVSDMENAIVYNLGYVKGETANNSKKLLSLMDLKAILVESNVPEEFIKDVKLGSAVTIIPQADKSKKYSGKVTYISNRAENKNGETTVSIEVSIDNNDGFLMPDFNVDLEIETEK